MKIPNATVLVHTGQVSRISKCYQKVASIDQFQALTAVVDRVLVFKSVLGGGSSVFGTDTGLHEGVIKART